MLDRSKCPVMEVSNNGIDWEERIVVGIYEDGSCVAVRHSHKQIIRDDFYNNNEYFANTFSFSTWNHYREIKKPQECQYCQKSANSSALLLEDSFISRFSWGWGGDTKINEAEAKSTNIGVFVDRGFLRMVDIDDCQCLESGEKQKINYCPMCGRRIVNEN